MTLVGFYKADAKYQSVASESHSALCAFKNDLTRRHDDGERYVEDVKSGKRELIPGITIADLERSLASQESTLEALVPLHC